MQWRIKLHRKMVDWERYTDHKVMILFLHLLLTVNHKDKKWRWNIIPKWSTIKTLATLSEELGLSVMSIRTCIKKLKSTWELTQSKIGRYGLITIVKYGEYQDINTNINTEVTQYQHDTNTEVTPNNNDKNIKNEKNKEKIYKKDFLEFRDKYPVKKWKAKAYEAWNKKKSKPDIQTIAQKIQDMMDEYEYKNRLKEFVAEYKHPTTWINQECRDDEYETWKKLMPRKKLLRPEDIDLWF